MNFLLLSCSLSELDNSKGSVGYFTKVGGISILKRLLLQFQYAGGRLVFILVPEDFKVFIEHEINDFRLNLDISILRPSKIKSISDASFLYIDRPCVLHDRLVEYCVNFQNFDTIKNIGIESRCLGFDGFDYKVSTGLYLLPRGVKKKLIGPYINKAAFDKFVNIDCEVIYYDSSDFKQVFYHAIYDFKSIKFAQKDLIFSLRTDKDSFISRYLNRPISLFFTRYLFMKLPFTPNYVSIFTLFLALMSAYFLILPGYLNGFIAGLLFHFSSVFDGCDGELARLRFEFSDFGKILDSLIDDFKNLLFYIFVGIRSYFEFFSDYSILDDFFYYSLIVSSFLFICAKYIQYKFSDDFKNADSRDYKYFFQGNRKNKSFFTRLISFASRYAHIDMIAFNALIAGIFDLYYIGFWLYSFFFIGLFFVTFYQQFRLN